MPSRYSNETNRVELSLSAADLDVMLSALRREYVRTAGLAKGNTGSFYEDQKEICDDLIEAIEYKLVHMNAA